MTRKDCCGIQGWSLSEVCVCMCVCVCVCVCVCLCVWTLCLNVWTSAHDSACQSNLEPTYHNTCSSWTSSAVLDYYGLNYWRKNLHKHPETDNLFTRLTVSLHTQSKLNDAYLSFGFKCHNSNDCHDEVLAVGHTTRYRKQPIGAGVWARRTTLFVIEYT